MYYFTSALCLKFFSKQLFLKKHQAFTYDLKQNTKCLYVIAQHMKYLFQFVWFFFLPSTLSAAQYFPDVSSSHASFLSEMRKLLW